MNTLSPRIATAISNALGWLDANPERHIAGVLAVGTDGVQCEPTDPKAECFCMLGRISKELGVAGYPELDQEYYDQVEKSNAFSFPAGRIVSRNDATDWSDLNRRSVVCKGYSPGNREVLTWLSEGLNVPIAPIDPVPPTWWQRLKAYF